MVFSFGAVLVKAPLVCISNCRSKSLTEVKWGGTLACRCWRISVFVYWCPKLQYGGALDECPITKRDGNNRNDAIMAALAGS